MNIVKPTLKSALAGMNKAIKDLRTVQNAAQARISKADENIEIANEIHQSVLEKQASVKKSAEMDANHAGAVADKLEALVSPDFAVENA